MVAITERALGSINATAGKSLVTVTGTEVEVAIVLSAGTGLADSHHKWDGDKNKLLWQAGVLGAVSIAYISEYPQTS